MAIFRSCDLIGSFCGHYCSLLGEKFHHSDAGGSSQATPVSGTHVEVGGFRFWGVWARVRVRVRVLRLGLGMRG